MLLVVMWLQNLPLADRGMGNKATESFDTDGAIFKVYFSLLLPCFKKDFCMDFTRTDITVRCVDSKYCAEIQRMNNGNKKRFKI